MTRPLVIAHRGHSARYPENTLEAYRAAIASGADLVETDARLSADGVVIASHDPDPVSYTHLDVYKRQVLGLHFGAPVLATVGRDQIGRRPARAQQSGEQGLPHHAGADDGGGAHLLRFLATTSATWICLLYTSRCV